MSDPVITCKSNPKQLLRLKEQISITLLPPKDRAKFLRSVGNKVVQETRKNIRQQQTVDGGSMVSRKNGKGKLLRKMAKGLYIKRTGDFKREITWKNGRKARIASRHQYGISQNVTAPQQDKELGSSERNSRMASRSIAKQLLAEGYKLPVRKKKGGVSLRRVSAKWIMQNMTNARAAMIIHLLRGDPKKRPRTWKIKVPARPFLGVTPEQATKYTTELARTALSHIKRA